MGHTISKRSRAKTLRPLALLFGLLCAFQVHSGNRYALLIGLNHYRAVGDVVELKYAENDVQELGDRLKAAGYDVHTLTNERAMRRDILGELQRYALTLRPDDTFVLFFAGHGVRRPWGQPYTYWLTYDADLSFLDGEGIRLTHLLEYVQDIRAGRKLILLDHCFSGNIGQRTTGSSSPVEVAVAQPLPPVSSSVGSGGSRGPTSSNLELVRAALPQAEFASQLAPSHGMVVFAAAGNEAFELDSVKHGAFTEALLRAMRSREASGGKESLTLEQLRTFVKASVRTLTNNRQEFSELENGYRLSDWVFIDKLPIGSVEEARNKRAAYLEKLNIWEREQHLDLQTLIWCEEALNALIAGIEGGARPSVKDEAIITEIGKFMEVTGSPSILGPRLKERVKQIRQAP